MGKSDSFGDTAALLQMVVAGDERALERLLLLHDDRLARSIRRRIPAAMAAVTSAEDILQETYVRAFRKIGTFQTDGGKQAFYRWLLTIARNQLRDAIRRRDAGKRGGVIVNVDSAVRLLNQLPGRGRTPSSVAAKREAVGALQVALATLKAEHRQVIEWRYLSGLSAAETARRMGRTEQAIHGLCHRALKRLGEAMGRASQFISDRP